MFSLVSLKMPECYIRNNSDVHWSIRYIYMEKNDFTEISKNLARYRSKINLIRLPKYNYIIHT